LAKAFVLLNCNLGFEESIIEQLKQINSVKEVSGTFGAYDILAKLETATNEELNNLIRSKVRRINNVISTMTLLTVG